VKHLLLLLPLLLSMPLGAEPKINVEVPLHVRTLWRQLDQGSAVRVQQAMLDGKPAVELPRFDFHCGFFMPQRRLVAGEPLLVEYRVWTEGDFVWNEPVGGRYRGSGRDDNFIFLLRREDGSWVPDPYGQVWQMGGISTVAKVDGSHPFSYWHPVQRWSALEKPGKYTLYALRWASGHEVYGRSEAINAGLPSPFRFDLRKGLVDSKTGEASATHQLELKWEGEQAPPSPLKLSADIIAELNRRNLEPGQLATYGVFPIEVMAGEPPLDKWVNLAKEERKAWPDNRATAARTGLWYVRTENYQHLAPWIKEATSLELTGLSLNPSREAAELLMQGPPREVLHSLYRLKEKHRPLLKPWLIRLQSSSDKELKELASQILDRW
jgi:hypothetical protein